MTECSNSSGISNGSGSGDGGGSKPSKHYSVLEVCGNDFLVSNSLPTPI